MTKAIETTQKRVESHNYEIRKSVLKFDDVMNKMREIIYTQRRQVLRGADVHSEIAQMRDEAILSIVDFYCPESKSAMFGITADWIMSSSECSESRRRTALRRKRLTAEC